MSRSAAALLAFLSFTVAACGSDGSSPSATSLAVTWTFASGDCSSLGVENVRITWGPAGGATQARDLPCSAGGGTLGVVDAGGSYAIGAAGFDAGGVQRAESFGTFVTLGEHAPPDISVNVTLRPKAANVIVSWSLPGGGGCPSGVILPYYISLYEAPAVPGGPLGQRVDETQVSCTAGEATLQRVAPGEYVVELDSRAVTPRIYGTASVTVVPGEDATVHLSF